MYYSIIFILCYYLVSFMLLWYIVIFLVFYFLLSGRDFVVRKEKMFMSTDIILE